jgi:hypothetical protein
MRNHACSPGRRSGWSPRASMTTSAASQGPCSDSSASTCSIARCTGADLHLSRRLHGAEVQDDVDSDSRHHQMRVVCGRLSCPLPCSPYMIQPATRAAAGRQTSTMKGHSVIWFAVVHLVVNGIGHDQPGHLAAVPVDQAQAVCERSLIPLTTLVSSTPRGVPAAH